MRRCQTQPSPQTMRSNHIAQSYRPKTDLSEDHDAQAIAVEDMDIVLHPLQCCTLVLYHWQKHETRSEGKGLFMIKQESNE